MLKTLQNIGHSLSESHSLKSGLSKVLHILYEKENYIRSFIILYELSSEKLQVFAAEGLSPGEFRRLEHNAGKGLIGEVFQHAKPVIIENTVIEKIFSETENHTISLLPIAAVNKNVATSLIAVPVFLSKKPLGVLCVEFESRKSDELEEAVHFLAVIAAMMAQEFKVEREMSAEKERLLEENTHLQQELKQKYVFGNLIGNSSPMRQVYDQIAQVARSNTTILLRGESGTGKEMIANALHYNSLRAKKPFIKVNCAALPETLIESELFGYERGAFTGANQRKKGRFELADSGTLFLDEIGDLPPQTQIKLLRVLQEREFERLGGTETIKINVRLVAATNKNLEEAISQGKFREDLFYRLNVFTIFLPPLRERKSDILLLAEYFVEKYERVHGKRIRRISTPAIDMLTAYHYPGNVRELENAIERAVLVCDSNVIHGHHLPPTLQTAEISGTVTQVSLEGAVEAFERDMIQDALKTTHGNSAKAAQLLETTERIIGYKIKKYGINPRRFRG